jgi:chemosensory pili system protein ChpA (sensor histidine kinase/response regulator)
MNELLGRTRSNGLADTPEVLDLLNESQMALSGAIQGAVDEATSSLEPLLSLYTSLLEDLPSDAPAETECDKPPGDANRQGAEFDEPLDDELLAVFREEAEDIFRVIDASLNQLEEDTGNREALQEIRRAAHTLKGAAGAVGLRPVTHLAHRMEDLLDQLYEGGVTITDQVLQVVYRGTDCLQELAIQSGDSVATAEVVDDLLGEFAQLMQASQTPNPAKQADADSRVRACDSLDATKEVTAETAQANDVDGTSKTAPPIDESSHTSPLDTDVQTTTGDCQSAAISWSPNRVSTKTKHGTLPARESRSQASASGPALRVPIEDLDQLVGVVSEMVVNRSQFELCLSCLASFVDELDLSARRVRQLSSELGTRLSAENIATYNAADARDAGRPTLCQRWNEGEFASEFDPLELDRYTEFHPLTQSLAEASDDLGTLGERIDGLRSELNSLLSQQSRLSYDMQDRLMDTRMVSLSTLISRLQRAVRSVAQETGKQVSLIVEGQDVEVDKKVLDGMADPLLHLLRNAVDHGIESVEERVAKGKPELANIYLRAFHRGTRVVIQVEDDGRGLQTDKIRKSAVQKNVISYEEAAALSADEVHALIFHVGFSTAQQVSEFSGRGVGMDVARQNVQQLQGSIEVASIPEQGSTFTISLPTSLSIAKAVFAYAGDELYAIPMPTVRHICRVPAVRGGNGQRIVGVDGQSYPLVYLSDRLGAERVTADVEDTMTILMVESGDGHVAMRVDRVLPSRDIIVKSLGSHLRRVPGLMGATLLGDGTVVPILELGELLDDSWSVQKQQLQPRVFRRPEPLTILFADDSVSVRKVMERLISNAGWNAVPAKDGVDALEVLERLAHPPQVFLLDVEMPRMDGFELLAKLRADDRYADVPVVMVSSRAGEKHRRKAKELGATEYVLKPFQEQSLLALICKLTGKARETVFA